MDNLSMNSKILNMERKFAVYLPLDYATSERSYPVLYLLHGVGDDQTGWVQFGEVKKNADNVINSGNATDMVIVMPDANTRKRGYFNSIDGEFRYEDFFFEELIPYIEKNYHVRAEKKYRAIAGLWMGGYGTIIYALHQPEFFVAACTLSAGKGLQDKESSFKMYKGNNSSISDDQLESYYQKHNGFELVNHFPKEKAKEVLWYIDCCDDDPRFENNAKLHGLMNQKGIPNEFRVRDG
jgi:enterochelin esterase-like enzyme